MVTRRTRSLAIIGAIGLAALTGGLIAPQISGGHAENSQPARSHRAARLEQPAARARVITASAVRTTITIDPDYGATFAPPPANAAPALTAQQAWAQFIQQASGSSNTAIPSTVTVHLGLFTLPIGPDCGATCSGDPVQNGIAYRSLNQLAYGYSSPGGTCVRGNSATQLPDVPCTDWVFVDANTGHMIVGTEQLQPASP
ncbi:MAG: hypothetical protein ACTHJW_25635 [Streptosporangiaceae bacterium]